MKAILGLGVEEAQEKHRLPGTAWQRNSKSNHCESEVNCRRRIVRLTDASQPLPGAPLPGINWSGVDPPLSSNRACCHGLHRHLNSAIRGGGGGGWQNPSVLECLGGRRGSMPHPTAKIESPNSAECAPPP